MMDITFADRLAVNLEASGRATALNQGEKDCGWRPRCAKAGCWKCPFWTSRAGTLPATKGSSWHGCPRKRCRVWLWTACHPWERAEVWLSEVLIGVNLVLSVVPMVHRSDDHERDPRCDQSAFAIIFLSGAPEAPRYREQRRNLDDRRIGVRRLAPRRNPTGWWSGRAPSVIW